MQRFLSVWHLEKNSRKAGPWIWAVRFCSLSISKSTAGLPTGATSPVCHAPCPHSQQVHWLSCHNLGHVCRATLTNQELCEGFGALLTPTTDLPAGLMFPFQSWGRCGLERLSKRAIRKKASIPIQMSSFYTLFLPRMACHLCYFFVLTVPHRKGCY